MTRSASAVTQPAVLAGHASISDNSEIRQQCIFFPSGCSWSSGLTRFSRFSLLHPVLFPQGPLLLPPPFVPPDPVASLAVQVLISITVMRVKSMLSSATSVGMQRTRASPNRAYCIPPSGAEHRVSLPNATPGSTHQCRQFKKQKKKQKKERGKKNRPQKTNPQN